MFVSGLLFKGIAFCSLVSVSYLNFQSVLNIFLLVLLACSSGMFTGNASGIGG